MSRLRSGSGPNVDEALHQPARRPPVSGLKRQRMVGVDGAPLPPPAPASNPLPGVWPLAWERGSLRQSLLYQGASECAHVLCYTLAEGKTLAAGVSLPEGKQRRHCSTPAKRGALVRRLVLT